MRQIVTEAEVKRRAELGETVIRLQAGAIVTPAAADEAIRLRVELVRGAATAEAVATGARRTESPGGGREMVAGPVDTGAVRSAPRESGGSVAPLIPPRAAKGPSGFRVERPAERGAALGGRLPRVAIMGGGHGGLATAAHLTLKGFPVTLFSFFESELEPVRAENGIQLLGDVEGFAAIDRVTTSVDAAVADADIIFVVYPALVHEAAATILAASLRDGQLILLTPGRTGGALEFARTLKRLAVKARVYIAESQTFMYAAEKRGPAVVHVAREKRKMRVAALPASDNEVVIGRLRRLYPQIEPAQNVLETSLNNIGAVVHPAPMLLNLPAIERAAAGEHVRHYRELITRSICEMVLEPLDAEKVSIAKAMGLDAWTARDWYRESYGVTGDSLFDVLQRNPYYAEFAAPTHFLGYHHILDEIPNSLVPIAHLGEMVGIQTPTIRAVVDLASSVCGFDFWHEGRTPTSLGIEGLSLDELFGYVDHGSVDGKCIENGLCLTSDGRTVTRLAHIAEDAPGGEGCSSAE